MSPIVQRLQAQLGADHVLSAPEQVLPYETATYATNIKVLAVALPASKADIQAILSIAQQENIPLYTVSSGRNWGYGSAVPTANGCLVLDLKRMAQIIEYNEDLAYVTIEPGVTQAQLYAFLQQQGGQLWMDATGSSAQCSIVGNTLERGFGHTPYGDHFSQVSGLEVVLADGSSFKTGFGRFANAQAAQVYHWGVGPYLDGLFSQSNLAIVTQMTLWLMPKPEAYEAFFCSVDQDDFAAMIDVLRPLRLDGTLTSAMHIVNGDKVVSAFDQYPWQDMSQQTPLTREWVAQRLKQLDVKEWSASGALYGTKASIRAAKRKIKQALDKLPSKKLNFLNARTLKVARWLQRPYQWLTGVDLAQALDKTEPVFYLKQGVPTNAFIGSTYWRKRQPPPVMDQAHPDRDKCGLLWLAPVAPMTGHHARHLADMVAETLLAYGFEPAISMTLLSPRCIDCVICITYDREIEQQEQQALACHDDLLKQLTEQGYYPYRLSTHAMAQLPAPDAAYSATLAKIKHALDPNHILSPGRYQEPDIQQQGPLD